MPGTPRSSPPPLTPLYDVGGDPARSEALVRPSPVVQVVSDAAIGSATSKLNDIVETRFSNLRDAFRQIDKDGSGKLTHDEVMAAVVGKWKMSERDQQAVSEVLKRSDKDGDGLINYREFATGLTHQSQQDKDLFRMDNRDVSRDEGILLKSQGNHASPRATNQTLDAAGGMTTLTGRGEGINDSLAGDDSGPRELAELARRNARYPAGRKFAASATLPTASAVKKAAVAAQHPIDGAPTPQPHRPRPPSPRTPRAPASARGGITISVPMSLESDAATLQSPRYVAPTPPLYMAPTPPGSTDGAVPPSPRQQPPPRPNPRQQAPPPPPPTVRPQRLISASFSSGAQGGASHTFRAGGGIWEKAAPPRTAAAAASGPQETPSAKYRPRIQIPLTEWDVQPRASLTPRESSYGLKGPASPRHGPRGAPQFANLAGGATPRSRFAPPARAQRYGTSLNLPSMQGVSTDPTQHALTERANTPRAPPNDQVRPPPRPKFLNPKFVDPKDVPPGRDDPKVKMSPRSTKRLSQEMQGHLSGLVFAGEVAAEEAAAETGYDQPRLSNGDSMHDRSPVKRGMPELPKYKLDGKLMNAPPPPEDASKGKYNMEKQGNKITGKFAWSSERIAHELVCKFDQFTARRQDHLNKLMWAVASDPNFDGIGCGTKGERHPVAAKNDANIRVTPANFPRICHRFGLACTEKESAEIFQRHNLPADGSVNMYTLAKQMRSLSEGKDTGQMMRECENAIFGTPGERPVTPKVVRDPYRYAKLPKASWEEHSQTGTSSYVGLKAAGSASPRGSESTALW